MMFSVLRLSLICKHMCLILDTFSKADKLELFVPLKQRLTWPIILLEFAHTFLGLFVFVIAQDDSLGREVTFACFLKLRNRQAREAFLEMVCFKNAFV